MPNGEKSFRHLVASYAHGLNLSLATRVRVLLLGVSLLLTASSECISQAASTTQRQPAEPVFSMGQPDRWLPYAALGAGRRDSSARGVGLVGVYHPVLNPVAGLFGLSAEAYGGLHGGSTDGGGRIFANAPAFAFGAGLDWHVTTGSLDPIITFQTAVRRGGLLGGGTMLRIDWLPWRGRTGMIGVQAPLMQRFAGRTRPQATSVELPQASDTRAPATLLPPTAEDAIARVAAAAASIRTYSNLYSEENDATLGSHPSYTAATRTYGEALASAFGSAAEERTRAERIARRARYGLLNEVILPYDALFGQVKHNGRSIDGLLGVARESFRRWVRDSSGVSSASQARVLDVHSRWLGIIDDVFRRLFDQWEDSRLVWLPPQLALAPDEYDEQREVDTLIERAVGRAFSDNNQLTYLRTSDFRSEIARSILAARSYHVLWTHDFTGRRETGALDEVAYNMVADVYLPALTAAVQRYDSTGTMPQYLLFLDAFYYHGRDGALWMNVLEDPLNASIHLRADERKEEAHVRDRLAALRIAVARSSRLLREAAAQPGSDWLAKVVKVHVNVTLPSDFSFRSHRIVPPFPFTPDNIVRDHRKLAFYDITEANPYDGAVIITGIGIGEHYASATWEDRGYLIRGMAGLETRDAARRYLRGTGVREEEIPVPLRASALPDTAANRSHPDEVGRALQVHNEVGFGRKSASVARAMLYNLAPPGSVIIVPDPLWLSSTWAGMLAGSAARGCKVIIIAPALANAPSPQTPLMVLERDLMLRLLSVRDKIGGQMRDAGGELRLGLYAAHAHVDDVVGRVAEVHEGLRRAPWIRELVPFDDRTLAVLDRASGEAAAKGGVATAIAQDVKPREPQLHQKTVFIARPGAIAALVQQPGWDDALARSMRVEAQAVPGSKEFGQQPRVDSSATRSAALLEAYERSLSAADRNRVSFYFAVGTQNHDPRGIMLDGEATLVVSGFHASAGLVDLFYLMTRSTWVERPEDIERLVPAPRGLVQRLAHWFRFAM